MAEAYPTFLAGQRITATLLRSGQEQVARKTSDTSRSAVTVTSADPHLQFEVVANAAYRWHGWVKYDGPAAGDLALDFSAPSGALGEWAAIGVGNSPVIGASAAPALLTDTQDARGYLARFETNDVTSARSYGTLGTGGTPLTAWLYGTLRTSTSPGTFSLDWSQFTSNATALTLYTDSWLSLLRVA
ncbi:hypothetical protein [Streptomyces sp. NPDC086182]|jgi:hypothetical protein|uniref:hypothetical protein n=1 Tax=Streptomyces sp. NPDC086182 TaxID=3155058 RepID=UPI0034239263